MRYSFRHGVWAWMRTQCAKPTFSHWLDHLNRILLLFLRNFRVDFLLRAKIRIHPHGNDNSKPHEQEKRKTPTKIRDTVRTEMRRTVFRGRSNRPSQIDLKIRSQKSCHLLSYKFTEGPASHTTTTASSEDQTKIIVFCSLTAILLKAVTI